MFKIQRKITKFLKFIFSSLIFLKKFRIYITNHYKQKALINPNSKFIQLMNTIYFLFYFVLIWYLPIYICFDRKDFNNIFNKRVTYFFLKIFPCIIFFSESILNCITGIYIHGELIQSQSLILYNYFKS